MNKEQFLLRFKDYFGFPPKTRKQKISYIILTLLILILPYKNTAGGLITVTAGGEQKLQSPFNGEIEETIDEKELNGKINEGTIIAKIVSDEIESNLREIEEQKSKILTIKAELDVNSKQLIKYVDLYKNSSERYEREYSLYSEGGVSLNKLGEIERQMSTDRNNVNTQDSIIMKTRQEIKTAESELAQLRERKKYYENLVAKSEIKMPFDGFIYSQNLSSRIGSQVKEGDNIANASKILKYYGIMQVSENVARGVELDDNVEIRLAVSPLTKFEGKVKQINRAVVANDAKAQTSKNLDSGNNVKIVKETTGKVIEVKVQFIDTDQFNLVPGLTGWGKIERGYVPLFWAYSQSIIRFIQIEIWSWVP